MACVRQRLGPRLKRSSNDCYKRMPRNSVTALLAGWAWPIQIDARDVHLTVAGH